MRLRRARRTDLQRFWKWRNDPTVRRFSLNPRPIPLGDHRRWFLGRLADPEVTLVVATDGAGRPVGHARIEGGEIHVIVARRRRGCGIGTDLIRRSVDRFRRAHPGARIRARVRPENLGSLRAFLKAGFRAVTRVRDRGAWVIILHGARP